MGYFVDNTPVQRHFQPYRFADAGWLYLLAGLALLAAAMLIPGHNQLLTIKASHQRLQQEDQRLTTHLARSSALLESLEDASPDTIRRLAAAQLNVIPADYEPVIIAPNIGSALQDAGMDSSPTTPNDAQHPRTRSHLSRWTTGSNRLWFLATGGFLCLLGIVLTPTPTPTPTRRGLAVETLDREPVGIPITDADDDFEGTNDDDAEARHARVLADVHDIEESISRVDDTDLDHDLDAAVIEFVDDEAPPPSLARVLVEESYHATDTLLDPPLAARLRDLAAPAPTDRVCPVDAPETAIAAVVTRVESKDDVSDAIDVDDADDIAHAVDVARAEDSPAPPFPLPTYQPGEQMLLYAGLVDPDAVWRCTSRPLAAIDESLFTMHPKAPRRRAAKLSDASLDLFSMIGTTTFAEAPPSTAAQPHMPGNAIAEASDQSQAVSETPPHAEEAVSAHPEEAAPQSDMHPDREPASIIDDDDLLCMVDIADIPDSMKAAASGAPPVEREDASQPAPHVASAPTPTGDEATSADAATDTERSVEDSIAPPVVEASEELDDDLADDDAGDTESVADDVEDADEESVEAIDEPDDAESEVDADDDDEYFYVDEDGNEIPADELDADEDDDAQDEYEYVYVDEDGNEIPVDELDALDADDDEEEDAEDEDEDAVEEYEYVYVDEDGNEIDPELIDEDDEFELIDEESA
jgi:hypothetical protein